MTLCWLAHTAAKILTSCFWSVVSTDVPYLVYLSDLRPTGKPQNRYMCIYKFYNVDTQVCKYSNLINFLHKYNYHQDKLTTHHSKLQLSYKPEPKRTPLMNKHKNNFKDKRKTSLEWKICFPVHNHDDIHKGNDMHIHPFTPCAFWQHPWWVDTDNIYI